MKRIKSAPANLAMMAHKKNNINTKNSKNNIIFFNKKETNNIVNYNYTQKKIIKNDISYSISLLNDIINENNDLSIEESNLIYLVLNYLSNNYFKKIKINELINYLLQSFFRYIIFHFLHSKMYVIILNNINEINEINEITSKIHEINLITN